MFSLITGLISLIAESMWFLAGYIGFEKSFPKPLVESNSCFVTFSVFLKSGFNRKNVIVVIDFHFSLWHFFPSAYPSRVRSAIC